MQRPVGQEHAEMSGARVELQSPSPFVGSMVVKAADRDQIVQIGGPVVLIPFEQVVEQLRPGRDLSRAPLFQVMFNMTPIPSLVREAGPVSMHLGRLIEHGVANFDLSLNIGEHAGGATFAYEVDSAAALASSCGSPSLMGARPRESTPSSGIYSIAPTWQGGSRLRRGGFVRTARISFTN